VVAVARRRSKRIYYGDTDLRDRRETVYRSPRMHVEFSMNRRGIARIAVGQDLRDSTRSLVVQKAMPYAIRISPRGDTLEYVSSWRAVDTFVVIAGMRRAACKLWNISDHAATVEWVGKSGKGQGRGVLRRTLAHLNATSPIGIEQAAADARAKATWNPQLHPRGPRGRFVTKPASEAAGERARDQMRQRIRDDAAEQARRGGPQRRRRYGY
jgi:hypothetical protein